MTLYPLPIRETKKDGFYLAGHHLLVNGVDLFLGGLTVGDVVQAVVGSAAAHLGKELDALGQGIGHAVDAGQLLLAHNSGQLAHVLSKAGVVDVDGLIRTEGRSHGGLDGGILLDLLVPVLISAIRPWKRIIPPSICTG